MKRFPVEAISSVMDVTKACSASYFCAGHARIRVLGGIIDPVTHV